MPTQVVSEVVLALGKKQRVNSIGQARGLASVVVKAGNFKNVSNSAMINRLIDLAIIPEHIGHQSGIYRRGPKPYSAARLLRGMLRRHGL